MTAQVPDSCMFEGRKYAISSWDGDTACIPTNEELNVETVCRSTAIADGRINHFAIENGKLYLFKVELSLPDGFDRSRIAGRRQETLIRYEPMTRVDKTGRHGFLKEWRFDFLVLDNCMIPFTGDLDLEWPCGDAWESPLSDEGDAEKLRAETLTFVEGRLT